MHSGKNTTPQIKNMFQLNAQEMEQRTSCPAHFDSLDRLTAGRKNQSDECNTAKIKKETVSS